MVMRAAEKIIEGLTTFMEGYLELQHEIERDFRDSDEEDYSEDEEGGTAELTVEMEAAIVTELRASVEAVMDAEDYSTEEMAQAVTNISDAIEEIDPDVFTTAEEEDAEEEEIYGDDEEYDDEDYDEDYDEDSLDELEEEELGGDDEDY